jgi:hypothetical protein
MQFFGVGQCDVLTLACGQLLALLGALFAEHDHPRQHKGTPMTHISASAKTASILLAIALGPGMVFAQTAGHGSDQMKKSMESGMKSMQSMSMSGDTDKDFAMMMKMHHQQALEMAKVEAEHGKSPELKKMAAKIIKDQTQEIEQLDKWMMKNK